MPLEIPAVTVPSGLHEGRLHRREPTRASHRGAGAHRGPPACRRRACPPRSPAPSRRRSVPPSSPPRRALLALEREARPGPRGHAVALGDLFGGLAERDRPLRRHLRDSRSASRPSCRPSSGAARVQASSGLSVAQGARDMLSTPPAMKTSPSPARMACAALTIACSPDAAQAVHRLARHFDRQPGEQRRHARHVAIVLARLVGAAEDHVVDRASGSMPVRDTSARIATPRRGRRPHARERAAVRARSACARRPTIDRVASGSRQVHPDRLDLACSRSSASGPGRGRSPLLVAAERATPGSYKLYVLTHTVPARMACATRCAFPTSRVHMPAASP